MTFVQNAVGVDCGACCQADVSIQAGYGSAKDIYVYQQLGISKERIFIVGKASKKQCKEAVVSRSFCGAHRSLVNDNTTP